MTSRMLMNMDQCNFTKNIIVIKLSRRKVKNAFFCRWVTICYIKSYMILSAIGIFHSPMHVLVQESSGTFPDFKPDPINVQCYAYTANPTKQHLITSMRKVFFDSTREDHILLLVDS